VVLSIQRLEPIPWIEVHCHGGVEVVRWLLEIVQSRDVQLCTWQELDHWTTEDPLQAAAAATLVEAPTVRTAGIVLDQFHGAFGQVLKEIRVALQQKNATESVRLLEALARYADVGRHLTTPWRVAVLGAPNVGKSSLVNALAGYQRSVVAATPGTTRDVVTTLIAVDGWPVQLADTAGLRERAETLEEQGIDRARLAGRAADLCLWVVDASTAPIWPTVSAEKLRLVVNKVDLPAAWNLDSAVEAVRVSARTGAGIPELCQALAAWLVPEPPPAGTPIPFTSDLVTRIDEVHRLCTVGQLEEAERILNEIAAPMR
jgi:tRNA modification GTPase